MYLYYRNIIFGIVGIIVGLSGLRYYIGFPKYKEEDEIIRVNRVKKYGAFLLLSSIATIGGGISLLFLAFD